MIKLVVRVAWHHRRGFHVRQRPIAARESLLPQKSKPQGSGVIVAYDTRSSPRSSLRGRKILAFTAPAYLCTRGRSEPCVSFETIRRKAMGAINFTASHNPPEYNGLKFSTSNGAPALPDVTRQIEHEIHLVQQKNERLDVYERTELIEEIDPKDRYLKGLRQKVDVDIIREVRPRIAIDALYGTSRDYLDYFLLESGIEVKIIHNYRDPYFGGFSPECSEKNLGDLRNVVAQEHFDLGLATDGDADRFGIIDDRARFVPANTILGLLAVYLKRHRNIPGGLARTVATTHLIDAIARKLEVPLFETQVGFKVHRELILADKVAFGRRGIGRHVDVTAICGKGRRPGLSAGGGMVSRTRKELSELIDEMHEEFGHFYSKRIDLSDQPAEGIAGLEAREPAAADARPGRTRGEHDRRRGS